MSGHPIDDNDLTDSDWLARQAPHKVFPVANGNWTCELCDKPIHGPIVGVQVIHIGPPRSADDDVLYGCLHVWCARGVIWGRDLFAPITGRYDYKVVLPWGWPNDQLLHHVARLHRGPWANDLPPLGPN